MARIANVNIPSNKRLVISLTYIHGIGNSLAKKICKDTHISENKITNDLTNEELISLRNIIGANYKVEGDLKREVAADIKEKKDIKCYKGVRLIRGMPARGQNTRSNANTAGRRGGKVSVSHKISVGKKGNQKKS